MPVGHGTFARMQQAPGAPVTATDNGSEVARIRAVLTIPAIPRLNRFTAEHVCIRTSAYDVLERTLAIIALLGIAPQEAP